MKTGLIGVLAVAFILWGIAVLLGLDFDQDQIFGLVLIAIGAILAVAETFVSSYRRR